MIRRTPRENWKDDVENFLCSFLEDKYCEINLLSLKVYEDFSSSVTVTELVMSRSDQAKRVKCKGTGAGVIHSLFLCLKDVYAKEYSSLGGINLVSFVVDTNFDTATSFEKTDACVEVVVEFKNPYQVITPFRATSSSLLKAAAEALIQAVRFYINSEKAFLRLKMLIKDAEDRCRPDLKTELVYKITKIVGVSSYEDLAY